MRIFILLFVLAGIALPNIGGAQALRCADVFSGTTGRSVFLAKRLEHQSTLENEMATKGLLQFLADRGWIKENSTSIAKIKNFFLSRPMQLMMSATSFVTLAGPTPMVILPHLKLFSISKENLDTLIVLGLQNPRSQFILKNILPEMERDTRYNDFVSAFNRLSLMVALFYTIMNSVEDTDKAIAENSDKFFMDILKQIDQIKNDKDLSETKDDIHFDLVVQHIMKNTNQPLSAEDINQICKEIPAPHRCQTFDLSNSVSKSQ